MTSLRQARTIEKRLELHSLLMGKYEVEGLSHNLASEKAFEDVKGLPFARLVQQIKEHKNA